MIKIDNNAFYLTAGDSCCSFKSDENGKITSIYFGKRIEAEDDIESLGITTFAPQSNFVLTAAEVADDKHYVDIPMLGGSKTLVLSFADNKAKLRKKVFVTPYPRGGFAVRTEVYNDGKKPISLGSAIRIASFGADFETLVLSEEKGAVRKSVGTIKSPVKCGNFVAALSPDCTESHGYAFGFLCAYGNGELEYAKNGDTIDIVCSDGGDVTVGGGESYCLPETLAVFSENGLGGITRAFHDILREFMCVRAERRPIVLFCTDVKDKIAERVAAASELGCDTFAVCADKTDDDLLASVSEACKAVGIKFGVKFCPNTAVADNDGVRQYVAELERKISMHGAEYVLIDLPHVGVKKYARAVFALRNTVTEKRPETLIEWGAVPDDKRYTHAMCYPVCSMRAIVDTDDVDLKTKFDSATFGALAYECDPLKLDGDKKRAIRAQIFSYQDDCRITLGGDLYRPEKADGKSVIAVSKDKSKAYAVVVSEKPSPRIWFAGLDEHNLYNVRELGKTFSGAALMYCGIVIPSHHTTDRQGKPVSYALHLRQVADYE